MLVDKKLASLNIINADENKKQNNPAKATVVNLGVRFLHLKETENIEKPNAEARPKISPIREFFSVFPNAITHIPKAATIIDIQTVNEILSFKNKNPSNAVINGIAANIKRVTAAVVIVIEKMKPVNAVAKNIPPRIEEKPIFKKFL